MCIIVAKNQGIPLPSIETLKNCWESNRHGAGLMYADRNQVHIIKGLMTWESFAGELEELGKSHDLDKLAMVLHFRISTQAGINSENTHPFPITSKDRLLVAPRSTSKIGGVVHNGIIPKYSTLDKDERHSDTFYFVKYFLSKQVRASRQAKQCEVQMRLDAVAQSKLAILLPDSTIVTIGDFVEDDNVLYSNNTYRPSLGYYGKYLYPYSEVYDFMDDDYDNWFDDYRPRSHSVSGGYDSRLYPCTSEMFFFDTETCDYLQCNPSVHYYDAYGELWFMVKNNGAATSLGVGVYDKNGEVVSPPRARLLA